MFATLWQKELCWYYEHEDVQGQVRAAALLSVAGMSRVLELAPMFADSTLSRRRSQAASLSLLSPGLIVCNAVCAHRLTGTHITASPGVPRGCFACTLSLEFESLVQLPTADGPVLGCVVQLSAIVQRHRKGPCLPPTATPRPEGQGNAWLLTRPPPAPPAGRAS